MPGVSQKRRSEDAVARLFNTVQCSSVARKMQYCRRGCDSVEDRLFNTDGIMRRGNKNANIVMQRVLDTPERWLQRHEGRQSYTTIQKCRTVCRTVTVPSPTQSEERHARRWEQWWYREVNTPLKGKRREVGKVVERT